jgi:hypothetical protein
MKMKQQLRAQRQISHRQIITNMCGIKLQWWVDAFEEDAEENKNIPPTTSIDIESC